MENNDVKDKINEYLELYTKLWAFSGSIGVISKGEIILKKAYGYANIEHKVKNTIETKYKIWSLTKQFTSAAILILEERGFLKVEDSLKKYFPELHDLDPSITIHHLLNHTSGIFNYSNLPDSHRNFQRIHHEKSDLIKMFTSKPLDFKPGTKWNYSNTGYFLLGMLIEKISGLTYREFLSQNIFFPLGMLNTGVDEEKNIVENKASGYYLNGNELIHSKYINMNLISSSGAMYSTVEDLLIWDQALNSDKLLNRISIEKMNTPYNNNYGYGVEIYTNDKRRVVKHNGGCEGFLAEIHRYIDDEFAVVVLSNYGFTAVNKLCSVISSIAFGDKYDIPNKPKEFTIKNNALESYLGIYKDGDFKIEFKKENDNLFIIIEDEYILPVYPISDNVLHHTWIDEEYTFTKDKNDQIYLWGIKKI